MSTNTEQKPTSRLDYHEALGMMMWLMKHADYHSQWPTWNVDRDIVPALLLGQCKIYFDDNRNPVGFVTRAWLDDESKAQVIANETPLRLQQWKSGSDLMFADFVAPWGIQKIF